VRGVETLLALLLVVVLVVALGLAAVVLVQVLRRRRLEKGLRERAHSDDPLARGPQLSDPERIATGDVVTVDGRDWVVRGTLAMDEDGYRWKEHLLDASGVDGELRCWLSVEQSEGGLEVAVWQRVPDATLTPEPSLVHDGATWTRDEQGTARFTATGSTGTGTDGTMQYADYVGPAGALLALERFTADGSWETSTGRTLDPDDLSILHTR
jgi:hypothetical protein